MQQKQHSPVMLRTRQNIRENVKAFIIILILQILGLPLMSVTSQIFYHRGRTVPDAYLYDHFEIYLSISFIAVAIAVLSGIIISLRIFSYLYKKTQVDMNLSLPLTSSQRFLSDFFSGLAVYIIPYIIAVILSLISLSIGRSVYPAFYDRYFSNVSLPHCVMCGLFIMIMLYTLTTLVTVCCGNMFESFIYTLLINAVIPVFFLLTDNILLSYSEQKYLFIKSLDPIMLTSPFGGVLKLSEYAGGSHELYDLFCPPSATYLFKVSDINWFVKYFILTAILFVTAFILYKKRKAEDVSKPFVFSFIYYIFAVTLMICISGTLFLQKQYINAIIISAVVFTILELIRNRGLRHILKASVYYTTSIIISFSFVKISSATDGFGRIYKTPDASDVKAVSMSYSGFYNQFLSDIQFTDKENIERILKMQSDSLEYCKNNPDKIQYEYDNNAPVDYSSAAHITRHDASDEYLAIAYLMKNGKIIYRSYLVPYNVWSDNMAALSLSQEYKDRLVDEIAQTSRYYSIGGNGVNISYSNDLSHITEINPTSENNVHISYSKGSMHFEENRPADSEYIHDLVSAYKKDIDAQTEDDMKNFNMYCMINENYIGTSFTNTLKFMEKYKIDINVPYETGNRSSVNKKDPDTDNRVLISDSDQIIKNNKTNTNIITESCGTPSQYYTYKYDHDLLDELLKVAEQHYYTDEYCYIMSVGKNAEYSNYIIPPEYSDLAEKFMESAELNDIVWEKKAPLN